MQLAIRCAFGGASLWFNADTFIPGALNLSTILVPAKLPVACMGAVIKGALPEIHNWYPDIGIMVCVADDLIVPSEDERGDYLYSKEEVREIFKHAELVFDHKIEDFE